MEATDERRGTGMNNDETTWLALKDVFRQYGYGSLGAARNAVSASHFPVATFKLGRLIVIDKAVHSEFFQKHREVGLSALRNNKTGDDQQSGEDDA